LDNRAHRARLQFSVGAGGDRAGSNVWEIRVHPYPSAVKISQSLENKNAGFAAPPFCEFLCFFRFAMSAGIWRNFYSGLLLSSIENEG
jgi:hypothetical protein